MKEIYATELKALIKERKIVIADFFATWCTPCKELGILFESEIVPSLSKKYDDITFVRLNIDKKKNSKLCEELQIDSIPRVFIYFKQKLIKTIEGFDKEIRTIIEKTLTTLE